MVMPSDCREKILSNDYYDLLIDFGAESEGNSAYDLCYHNIEDLYSVLYSNKNLFPTPDSYFFDYLSVPKLYGLMQGEDAERVFDPNNLIISGITQVQRPPLSLTGRGTIICIIDTGIDYTNEVFRDADGNSRILAIWDQTIQSGTPPQGFEYGTEYTREQINEALQAEDPYSVVPSRDEIGHGSMMAGVAAGSRINSGYGYQGAAPDADIVVIKLKQCKQYLREFFLIPDGVPAYQENDIMLAVQYGNGFARTFYRPIVFCLGLGTSYGDHAGSSSLATYLSIIARRRSRAVVVGGGNEGNSAHHFQGNLDNRGGAGRENSVPVEVRVGENAVGFILELWGNVPDVYTISVRSPGGETIPPIRLGVQSNITYSFIYERTKITVSGLLVERRSGEELILLRVQDPTPGIWTFQVEAVGEIHNGEFHLWMPIDAFLNVPCYFLESSPYITLTEPAIAQDIISVSTYDGSNFSFYINSGRGFSRTGAIRPDFAAPGVNIPTIRGRQSGSSLAAAVTAGAVSQFMQWAVVERNNQVVEGREIKNYFIRGASRDAGVTYPNREWGYGRLNLAGTFDALIGV